MTRKCMDWYDAVVMVLLVPLSFLFWGNSAFAVVVPLFLLAWGTQEKTNHPLRAALKIFMLQTAIAMGVWCSVWIDTVAFQK